MGSLNMKMNNQITNDLEAKMIPKGVTKWPDFEQGLISSMFGHACAIWVH